MDVRSMARLTAAPLDAERFSFSAHFIRIELERVNCNGTITTAWTSEPDSTLAGLLCPSVL